MTNSKSQYATRAGARLVAVGSGLWQLHKPLSLALVLVVSAAPGWAQSTGPIFNGNASNLSNIVREGLKLMAVLLFCAGAIFTAVGIWKYSQEEKWTRPAVGAGACFAFGTIVAVLFNIAKGQAVDINTDF